MKAEIVPTEKKKRLKQNLDRRVEEIVEKGEKLVVETEYPSKLQKVPGIKSYTFQGEKRQGIGGKPVEKQAYAKVNSKKDAVKALIATIEGYDLRILNSERKWDLKQLKKYNPDIKHLKVENPPEFLEIDRSLTEMENCEKVDIDLPEEREEINEIYREMLT